MHSTTYALDSTWRPLLKDLGIVKALARELDIGMPVVEAAIRDYAELVARGEGNNDISGLVRKKRMERAG